MLIVKLCLWQGRIQQVAEGAQAPPCLGKIIAVLQPKMGLPLAENGIFPSLTPRGRNPNFFRASRNLTTRASRSILFSNPLSFFLDPPLHGEAELKDLSEPCIHGQFLNLHGCKAETPCSVLNSGFTLILPFFIKCSCCRPEAFCG